MKISLNRTEGKKGRYERLVPQEIRQLAEERGVPKPNRYVPSAQGVTVAPESMNGATNGSKPAEATPDRAES